LITISDYRIFNISIFSSSIKKNNENYINTGSKDTRSGFGAGMTELGQKNENVVALCADLIGSLKFDDFKKITQSVFSKSELRKQT
jgi:hypothetical protein